MKIHGRAFCGKICPFGFLQDWVFKIPFPKKIRTFRADKYLRYAKYVVLLAYLIVNVTMRKTIQNMVLPPIISIIIGTVIVLSCILMQRPLCKYVCPAGAIFSIINKTTRHKYIVDMGKCTQCKACKKSCKMDIVPYNLPNSFECIHCDMCVNVCPHKAITIVDTNKLFKSSDQYKA